MKKYVLMLVASLMLFSCSCSNEEESTSSSTTTTTPTGEKDYTGQTLSVWSLTDELQPFAKDFEERFGVKVEYTIVPNEQFQEKLRPVLRTGKNVPDVFVGEMAYVREWVESPYWEDLSKPPYNADVSDMVPYVREVGTDSKGALKGLSWQATPGGFFYKRSMAKEVFGTDDPAEIAKLFTTFDKTLETGKILKEKGYYLFSGLNDLFWPFFASRSGPWVNENNEFKLDPAVIQYFEYAKKVRDLGLDAKVSQWTPEWFNEMGENGKTFAFVLPTWGLHFVLKTNAPETSGDWAVVPGPAPFFWGGTWLGIYSGSTKKDLAWEFIKMMCLDEEYMKSWIARTGDYVSDNSVVNELKGGMSDPFLGGQNHYAYFYDEAQKINGKLLSPYDTIINGLVQELATAYAEGQEQAKDLNTTIETLYSRIQSSYPDVKIVK